MDEKIAALHKAIEEGANLIFRDGIFWAGPLQEWDKPFTLEEFADEHVSCSTEPLHRR